MVEILNPGPEDYHIHSLNFSDGAATIDEIVQYVGKLGLQKITITDHSQAAKDAHQWPIITDRVMVRRWKNVYNRVEVCFGIEGDLLDEEGNICSDIQGTEAGTYGDDFLILSAHDKVYRGDPTTITQSYLRALELHHQRIKCVGHPCARYFAAQIDISQVVEAANSYGIPLELNGSNLANGKTNRPLLRQMLQQAQQIYVNSDAHTLNELRDSRRVAFKFLREEGIIGRRTIVDLIRRRY